MRLYGGERNRQRMPPRIVSMSNADPRSSRLATAIRLSLEFRAQRRTDVAEFLAEHAELCELLEPMLQFDEEADAARDGVDQPVTPTTAATAIAPGRQLGGYRLERELGRGGMGVVFAAWQRSLDRTVALKVLSAPTLLVSERALWRFQREGKLLATLDHPAIVKIIETGVHGGIPFLAMELVHGASLAAVLAAVRRAGSRNANGDTLRAALLGAVEPTTVTPTPWRLPTDYGTAVATIVATIAEALHTAHQAGVVHRDVKPSNILLRQDGQALLADFGVAHQTGAVPLTVTGDLAGTPTYMSPEQVRGAEPGPASDVFSLGVVLYEALTLQLPFPGADTATVVDRLLHHEPIDVRRLAAHLSPALAAIAHHALAKSPARRYATAAAFAADLRAALAGEPIVARPTGRLTRLWRWMQREPWRAAAAGLGIATVFGLGTADRIAAHQLQRETSRTVAALAEAQRLEIGVRIDRALEIAKTLRLPRLEELPAHERWLREHGEPLAAELPRLEQLLQTVQAEAEPYDEAAAAADRRSHPDAAQLAVLTAELTWYESRAGELSPARTARAAELQQAMPALQQRVATRRTWRFADERRQFLHDELVRVVDRLRRFTEPESGALAEVRRATQFALENHHRCLEEPRELWRTIAADVAADPRFGGLRLAPQCDLVPLGKNEQGLWEFVHLPSGESAQQVPPRDANGRLTVTPESGIVLVLLPGGLFPMGAQAKDPNGPNYDPAARPDEGPVQQVRLDPFFCGKYEVTQAQWHRLAGDWPSYRSAQRSSPNAVSTTPVDSVSQQNAATKLHSVRLRLPNEAQWEYACRAGTTAPWSFDGRQAAPRYANFGDRNSGSASTGRQHEADLDDGNALSSAVGSYLANPFGLHDMHGNVCEHVAEAKAPAARRRSEGSGEGIATYMQMNFAIRGGSSEHRLNNVRSSDRSMLGDKSFVSQLVGCRAVREVMP
jgi:serine/threonine protein kinase/formylglycine-generating enzyme required for sulfatase activity